jgi:CPA1 family monovalent cation:H+ antiporter
MLNIHVDNSAITIGLVCIIIVFVARLLSILVPDFILGQILRRRASFSLSKSTLLAWGGIRGGLSIALALSIDGFPDGLVAITYVVVLSSILIQGGTFKWAIGKLARE